MKVIEGRHSPAITGQMCGGDVESKAILLDGGANPQVWIQLSGARGQAQAKQWLSLAGVTVGVQVQSCAAISPSAHLQRV